MKWKGKTQKPWLLKKIVLNFRAPTKILLCKWYRPLQNYSNLVVILYFSPSSCRLQDELLSCLVWIVPVKEWDHNWHNLLVCQVLPNTITRDNDEFILRSHLKLLNLRSGRNTSLSSYFISHASCHCQPRSINKSQPYSLRSQRISIEIFNYKEFKPFYASILPPSPIILCFSSGSLGLWSLVNSITCHPCSVYLHMMALESPTLAVNI